LDRDVVGRRVEEVSVGRERVVRRTSAEALIDGVSGVTIVSADRRGKYLLLPLDSGESLMVHLRMSGQLLLAEQDAIPPPHTHVRLRLDDGRSIWFVDPRTFGEMVVFDPRRVEHQVPELARLGVDPIADPFDVAALDQAIAGSRRALKPLLLDQHVIAGIGNIYADEILHDARLRPDRRADSLSRDALGRLHASIISILTEAIGAGGSSLSDQQYVDLTGISGSYQVEHRVYGRAGERCATCGRGWVRRVVAGGRGTHFCGVCQH
jgi:formamidopyrimidine-DNA glycosylase